MSKHIQTGRFEYDRANKKLVFTFDESYPPSRIRTMEIQTTTDLKICMPGNEEYGYPPSIDVKNTTLVLSNEGEHRGELCHVFAHKEPKEQ